MSIELRKKPKQARSLQRFNTILQHAERIIQDVGITDFKISELARHANVNIATIYQYFPNQPSLLRHLMEKNVEAFESHVMNAALPMSGQTQDVVQSIVECTFAFFLSHPVFYQLRGVSQTNEALQALSIQDTKRMVEWFMPAVNRCVPDVSQARVRSELFMWVEASMHLLQVSASLPEDERQTLVKQTQRMMVNYLETFQ